MPAVLRSRLLWIAVVLLILAALAVRFWLGGYVVRSVIGMAGGSGIRFTQVRATPWRVVVEGLHFSVRTQDFSARRVTIEREHWWMASLGNVRVEGAQVAVTLDGSDVNPWVWSTYDEAGLGGEPVNLPFQSLDLDGELIVQMATVADVPVAVKLDARPKGGASWVGSLVAEAPGFRLAGGGSLLRAGQELDFQVHSAELDLETWAGQIQRLVPLPGSPWTMGGKLTGIAEGKVTAKRFAATARVSLREGRMRAGTQDVAATGIEAELEFSDLWKLRTKSGELRLKELRIGRLPLTDLTADFGLWNGQTVIVNAARFAALGGRATVQPFRFQLNQREVAATVEVANLELAAALALTQRPPAQLTGRVDGTLPLRIHEYGLRLERGQLVLHPGSMAELRVSATVLLRSGAMMPAETQAVLRAAGNEPLAIRLAALRFDIRPADIQLGSSARLTAAGETDDGPVAFAFNVNGPVEKYLRVLP
jgi:hypothetical protein